jgi:hypothetical protein
MSNASHRDVYARNAAPRTICKAKLSNVVVIYQRQDQKGKCSESRSDIIIVFFVKLLGRISQVFSKHSEFTHTLVTSFYDAFDLNQTNLWIKVKSSEYVDGVRIFRDVVGVQLRETIHQRGRLDHCLEIGIIKTLEKKCNYKLSRIFSFS